ncbi:hypothetical protein AB0J09_62155, partial [Nonomuraea sp. NPDC049784]
MEGGWGRAREVSRRVARGVADAGRATARASRATAGGTARAGRATAKGARKVGKATRRLTHANGADRTGLGRLIELSAGTSACRAAASATAVVSDPPRPSVVMSFVSCDT